MRFEHEAEISFGFFFISLSSVFICFDDCRDGEG